MAWRDECCRAAVRSYRHYTRNQALFGYRQCCSPPARRSKTTPRKKGINIGTAGTARIKPGTMYHGAESAAGSGYFRTLITRKNSAMKLRKMYARVALRPSHWLRPSEAANAA